MKKIIVFLLMSFCLALHCFAKNVPILAYHDFVTENEQRGEYAVSESVFRSHIKALHDAGYTAVTFSELIDYVYGSSELPEKCVVISSDDGYDGVIDTAVSVCDEYGMKMTCAVIGSLVGKNGHFVPNTSISDSLEITSHSFDLHNCDEIVRGVRCDLANDREYEKLLSSDVMRMREVLGQDFAEINRVFVYPFGEYTNRSEAILKKLGYKVTVTCKNGVAHIEKNSPDSLRELPRIHVFNNMTAEKLLKKIEG